MLAKPLSAIFVGYDKALLELTASGMRIYALGFLTAGVNIFASAFFTALGNGGISLLISFSRTFVCQAIAVMLLPVFFGLNGVWSACAVAEVITLFLTIALFVLEKDKYHYA